MMVSASNLLDARESPVITAAAEVVRGLARGRRACGRPTLSGKPCTRKVTALHADLGASTSVRGFYVPACSYHEAQIDPEVRGAAIGIARALRVDEEETYLFKVGARSRFADPACWSWQLPAPRSSVYMRDEPFQAWMWEDIHIGEDGRDRCAACGYAKRNLVVDHDHETGRIRGMLCTHCNLIEPGATGNQTMAKYRRKNPATMVNYVERYVNAFGETPMYPDWSTPC